MNQKRGVPVKGLSPQLRRGLGLRFWLAVLATVGLIGSTFLNPVLQTLQTGGRFSQYYHHELILQALTSDTLAAFLPVLAALPLAAGYLEDIKSKFARFLLVRESFTGYLLGIGVACWLCGGGAAVLGALGAWGAAALVFTPLETVTEEVQVLVPQIVGQLELLFLCGGLWAVVGMALSTVMESKYIAYVSPFIVYYLLVILYERYLPDTFLLYPKHWLSSEGWPFGRLGAAVFLLEWAALAELIFYFRGKRRLNAL